jgi:inosine-uridine nucleoside N-ribohydrolase
MTNLALALSIEPGIAQAVSQVVLMGGAVSVPGNVSPVASANLYEDPEAAAIMYQSGAALVQVGLDVCNQVTISNDQLEQIGRANTPTARLLTEATPQLRTYYEKSNLLARGEGVRYNDLPAVAYAIDSTLFHSRDFYVTIETQSPVTRGQTVVDRRSSGGHPPNATVCLEVDAPRLAEVFTQRVAGYRGGPR